MEDILENSPDISVNHTNKRRISIISIILLIVIIIILGYIACKSIFKKDIFDLSEEVFVLSDKTTILFLDSENYALEYDILDEKVKMSGKYRFTYGDDINDNIKYEYKTYIEDFTKEDYILGFLELQNENLYIDGVKSEDGYRNTYFLLMIYFEDGEMAFSGYNVDTGIKIKFKKQKDSFDKYYKEFENIAKE